MRIEKLKKLKHMADGLAWLEGGQDKERAHAIANIQTIINLTLESVEKCQYPKDKMYEVDDIIQKQSDRLIDILNQV